ncbi:EEF1A lysine methyltransferase 2 [Drosophila grimshawi]|uniref:Protein-lysine N-methyltransferase Dgri_GH20919 n=1 Tax=Drosophila grimshawi TaxID=7222 RepID=B4J4Q6_DROGR|nr:EEF1A lysine methyltransferase 2 [Drosophila grimshawi]EDW00602.1 GH20919 [Drosophila grimshawi]
MELEGSELGTKAYWETSYEREIKNYKSHGDVGEIWFDEDSQQRIVDWLLKQQQTLHKQSARVLDLGCGNGMFLIALANEGFIQLTGVDYSPKAIELARGIAQDHSHNIDYKLADLTQKEPQSLGTFDIVHDKGTYDAVSLCPDNPKEMRTNYLDNVARLLHDEHSWFIITSCNWTEDELLQSFEHLFERHCTIPTPTFKFGGKVGNVVTSVVFKKRAV